MISIKELARLAKVSPSTVSKALNNRSDVSVATRKHILEIANQHQYSPNVFGKALKMQSSENIGIIFSREQNPLSDNPFYSKILEGIEAELAINNYNLVLKIISNQSANDLPKMIREKHVDGLILIGVCDVSFIENVSRVQLPTVFVDPQNQINESSQICIDNEHGAFLATQYLIQSGHREIGFISGELNRISFQQRYEGYLKALKFHKIELNGNLVRTGGIEQGYFHIKNILQTDKPTAIFAANDINALHGYKAVHDLNLKIPHDISIVGFDDISMAKFAVPPLTTIRVYKEEMGSIAVRTLLRTIHQRLEKGVTTIVPVELIKRDSVRVLVS